jgi:hypothetical protein
VERFLNSSITYFKGEQMLPKMNLHKFLENLDKTDAAIFNRIQKDHPQTLEEFLDNWDKIAYWDDKHFEWRLK